MFDFMSKSISLIDIPFPYMYNAYIYLVKFDTISVFYSSLILDINLFYHHRLFIIAQTVVFIEFPLFNYFLNLNFIIYFIANT